MTLNFTPLGDALASLGRGLARRQRDPAAEVAAVLDDFARDAQALLATLTTRHA